MGGDQGAGLVLVEAQQVAAQHREVAQQLGRQPGERQVPARGEEHPEGVGRGVEERRRAPGSSASGSGVRRRRRRAPAGRRSAGPAGVSSRSASQVASAETQVVSAARPGAAQPPGDAQRLAGAARTDEQRHGGLGRAVEAGSTAAGAGRRPGAAPGGDRCARSNPGCSRFDIGLDMRLSSSRRADRPSRPCTCRWTEDSIARPTADASPARGEGRVISTRVPGSAWWPRRYGRRVNGVTRNGPTSGESQSRPCARATRSASTRRSTSSLR